MNSFFSLILFLFSWSYVTSQVPVDTLSIINKTDQQVLCINEDTTLFVKTIDNSIRKKRGFMLRKLVTVYSDSLGILKGFYNDGILVKMEHRLRFTQSVFYFNNSKLIFVIKSCFEILPPLHQQQQIICTDRREKHNLYFYNEGFFRKPTTLNDVLEFLNNHNGHCGGCGGCMDTKELSTTNIFQLMNKCIKRLE